MFRRLPIPALRRTRRRDLGGGVVARMLGRLAAGSAFLLCACACADAQESSARPVFAPSADLGSVPVMRVPDLSLEPVSPAAPGLSIPAAQAGASTRKSRGALELEQSFDASSRGPAPPTIIIGQRDNLRIVLPDYLRPSEAFQAELRKRTLDSSRAQLYANLPYDMPELLEDDYILRQRSRVAESVMGSAVEKAIAVAFQGGVRRESTLSIRPAFATVDHGFKVDASPSWSYKVRTARSGLRFDLPLTPRPLRVHAWRDLRGTDRTPVRMGGGITVDPWDQSVRCGISFEF